MQTVDSAEHVPLMPFRTIADRMTINGIPGHHYQAIVNFRLSATGDNDKNDADDSYRTRDESLAVRSDDTDAGTEIPRDRNDRKGCKGRVKATKKPQKVYNCHICKYVSSDSSNMKVHMRTHTGDKPFRCEICKKQFRQKAHLTSHSMSMIHRNAKPTPLVTPIAVKRKLIKDSDAGDYYRNIIIIVNGQNL